MPHVVASLISLDYGIRGYVAAAGGASVAGAIAIGDAYRLIRDGYMDRVLVGGLDYNCNQNVLPGMDAFGALCTTFNEKPEEACMPFDKKRAGTVLSDGGAMIMLESFEHAKARKARQIYCEVAGFGQTNDAFNILQPYPDGLGIVGAMHNCMKEGNLHPSQLSLFNCHARSTSVGDKAEALAIKSMLAAGQKYGDLAKYLSLTPEEIVECVNDNLPKVQPIITCQKGNMGHTVAAAAVVESVISIKCIQEQFVPHIKNLDDPELPELNYCLKNKEASVSAILKNGYVFGGINCSILYKKL